MHLTNKVAFLLLVPAIVLFVAVDMPAPWITLYLSYCLPIFSRELKGDLRLLITFWILLSAHHILSLTNLFTTIPIAGADPANFHTLAEKFADSESVRFLPGRMAYASFLSMFYRWGGTSIFLGQELSIFAWALSVLLLLRLATELSIDRFHMPLLLIFGLEPYALLLTSQVMRESWQILSLIAVVLYSVQCLRGMTTQRVLLLLVGLLFFGMMNKALPLVSIGYGVLFGTLLVFRSGKAGRVMGTLILAITGLLTVALWHAAANNLPGTHQFNILIHGRIVDHINWYRSHIDSFNPRSKYNVSMQLEEASDLPLFTLATWWKYHTAPIGMGMHNLKDYYALVKSILRFIMFPILLILCWIERSPRRTAWLLMLALYIGVNLLWSIGTTNYGQALRHHIVTEWILLLASWRFIILFLKRSGGSLQHGA